MTIFNAIPGKPARWSRVVSVSTLAFLAFLGFASAGSQHSTDRGTDDSGVLEWGPTKDGVRTGLSATEESFALGKPISFRLVMENLTSRAVQFDPQQVAVNSSMSIERIDGTNVPYIKGSVQTAIMGDLPILKPRERKVLFEGLDIADQYLLTSPGTYKVRFRGQGEGFGGVAIPASNAVTVRVTDGPLKPSRLLARTLFDAVQASGWRLAIYKEGDVVPVGRSSVNGTALALTLDGRTKYKGDAPRALIWVTASPSAIMPPEPDVKRVSPAEAIGRCQWGEVYLWSANASAEELSTIRKLTATALKIDERGVPTAYYRLKAVSQHERHGA
jgi:hypothetical protein